MNLFNLSPIIFGIFRWYTMRLQLVGYDGMMKISVHKYLHISRVISLSKLQEIELLSQTICMFLRVLRYSDTLLFRKFVAIYNFHLNIATSVRPSITVHSYAFCLWRLFFSLFIHQQCQLLARHCIRKVLGPMVSKMGLVFILLKIKVTNQTLKSHTQTYIYIYKL